IVMLWGLALSALDWNDHYHIEKVNNAANRREPAIVKTVFSEWLANRPDLEERSRKQKPYVVFVISAQGGGMYAAYYAALFLARQLDREQTFAAKTFMISGVSGGGLGAAAFVAGAEAKNNGVELPIRKCGAIGSEVGTVAAVIRCYFRKDLLMPVVAG